MKSPNLFSSDVEGTRRVWRGGEGRMSILWREEEDAVGKTMARRTVETSRAGCRQCRDEATREPPRLKRGVKARLVRTPPSRA